MSLSAQEVTKAFFSLSEQEQQEAFDFMEFLKTKSVRKQAKRLFTNPESQNAQQTEGERVLGILERAGLLGCMEGGDGKLSENYKEHLWGNE